MITCQFPQCGAVLNQSNRGHFTHKYCSPHRDAIAKAKRKQHILNQIERKKIELRAKKLKLNPRCQTCNVSIMSFSLKKKYCPSCAKISGNSADRKCRRRKNMDMIFSNFRKSLKNNLIAFNKTA